MISTSRTLVIGDSIFSRGLRFPTAEPDDDLDYALDVTSALAEVADSIVSASVAIAPSGELAASNLGVSEGVISFNLAGGVAGRTYEIKIEATTGTRTFGWLAILPIDPSSAVYPLLAPPSMGFSTPLSVTIGEFEPSPVPTNVTDLGNVAGTLTVNAATNRIFKATLTGSVSNFTLSAGTSQYMTVLVALTQGGSGSNNLVYPGSFRWQGGFSPSLSTAVGATDLLQTITFDGGVTWMAAIVLQAAP